MTEAQEQAALFRAIRDEGYELAFPELRLLFHIPNGGRRDAREAAKFKAMGVKPGVPDLFLPVPRGTYHGLWIELKAGDRGRTSREQDSWLTQLRAQGYAACVCHGGKMALSVLTSYLQGEF